jgi:hypothetical protein
VALRNFTLAALTAASLLVACGDANEAATPPEVPAALTPSKPASFAGAETCAECHAAEAQRWRGSHHDHAMQNANAASVLGDFGDALFDHYGSKSRFFRRDEGYFVETAGADGELTEFEIVYTFGVEPLQQYLVRLPGGRLQPLPTAWDARPLEQGGQRWFHLYPDEPIASDDPLHWTGRVQNWNQMCADCHSTNLRKGYDLATDTYDTTWEELDVACEACHGPGSQHVAWARAGAGQGGNKLLVDWGAGGETQWNFVPGEPIAQRSGPPSDAAEIASCAGCHSRRTALREPRAWAKPFLDSYRPVLLDETLYHADGQIQDEVYVWGSFVQSRMFAAGVTCSDCHDPHSLAIADPADAHAHPHVHGGRRASRPQLPRAATGSVGAAGGARRVHLVSYGSRRRVGRRSGHSVVGRRAPGTTALRRDPARRPRPCRGRGPGTREAGG